MRRSWPRTDGITIRGRCFTQADLVLIRRLIREHPTWGRTRLSENVCRQLDWYQPNGRLKDRACRVALLRLEASGYLELPPRKQERGGRPPAVDECRILLENRITEMPSHIELRQANSVDDKQLWNVLISRYHYLGLGTPVGRLIRYLIFGDGDLLGAISFTESAWNIGVRNQFLGSLGMADEEIRDLVIGNNRFLIAPFVKVPNLASRVLSQSLRMVSLDWQSRFSCTPHVVETFVDPKRFHGTCYVASNWVIVGKTKGFTKRGASHTNLRSPKLVLLRGLNSSINKKIRESADIRIKRAA